MATNLWRNLGSRALRSSTPFLRRAFSCPSQSKKKNQSLPTAVFLSIGAFSLPLGIAYSQAEPHSSRDAADRNVTYKPIPSAQIKNGPPALSRYAVADAVEKVLPSVVNIRGVYSRQSMSLFSDDSDVVEMSCGSGFFISEEGLILTNAHVVSGEGNEQGVREDCVLHVTLSTGETYIAKVLAADFDSDIAIIKVNVDAPVPVAQLGDSDAVRPGEFVVAVGSPLTLSNSCSFGIISTIHRDLAMNMGESSGGLTYLQLDVAINQGSSGGPCVSLDGEVVGICSMKIAGSAEGIGFAIPIKYAQKVVEDLQTHGYVRRPYVGLTLISVTPDLFEDIRRDTNYRPPRWLEAEIRTTNSSKSVGLMVHNITKGGPGDRAGLRAGDVVVAVNNKQTTTTSEFLAALNFQVHKDCELKVRRSASGRLENVTIRPEVLQTEASVQQRRWRG